MANQSSKIRLKSKITPIPWSYIKPITSQPHILILTPYPLKQIIHGYIIVPSYLRNRLSNISIK